LGALFKSKKYTSIKPMTYKDRLRSARKHKGFSQNQLAEKSGVGQGSISKIERGDQKASAYDIELAEALDINPLWLRTGKEAYKPAWLGGATPKPPESNAIYQGLLEE
jgi:transcriptional regulator with XRE-family HTH domain